MEFYKEFLGAESQKSNQELGSFKPYSWPIYLYWQTARLTFLQMFPMKDITILNFYHSHSFMDICYIASGTGYLEFHTGEVIPLRRGTICYINTHVVHKMISDEESPLEACNLSFELSPYHSADKTPAYILEHEKKLLRRLIEQPFSYADDCYRCEDFLRNALALMHSRVPGDFVRFKNCISNFFMSSFQDLVGLIAESEEKRGVDNQTDTMAAMQMVFYMRDHYTEGISLADVAKELNYSPRQCQRLIQDLLGVGFSEFILAHQIRHAKKLLTSTEDSLEEVAEKSGFKSSKALTQQFKAMVGITPNMYRKSYKYRATGDSLDKT